MTVWSSQVTVLKQAYRSAHPEMTELLLRRGARLPKDAMMDLKNCIDKCKDNDLTSVSMSLLDRFNEW